jgi:hypothetical protein
VHNIVSTQIKGRIPKINRDYITYRSYKNFDHEKYVEDLEKIDYVNIGNESDINSTYEIFEKSYLEIQFVYLLTNKIRAYRFKI